MVSFSKPLTYTAATTTHYSPMKSILHPFSTHSFNPFSLMLEGLKEKLTLSRTFKGLTSSSLENRAVKVKTMDIFDYG